MKIKFTLIAFIFTLMCNAQGIVFQVQNQSFFTGDTVEAVFSVSGFTGIGGFQYAMKFDTGALRWHGVTFTGRIPNYNANKMSWHGKPGYNLKPGEIRTVWTSTYGSTCEDGETHTIRFIAKSSGQLSAKFGLWPGHWLKPSAAIAIPATPIPLEFVFVDEGMFVSATEAEKNALMAVFPNPVGGDGKANVMVSLKEGSDIQINVVDSAGYTVFGRRYQHGGGVESFEIDLPASGWYVLQIQAGSELLTEKIVRQ